jgi:hypothetical protein
METVAATAAVPILLSTEYPHPMGVVATTPAGVGIILQMEFPITAMTLAAPVLIVIFC